MDEIFLLEKRWAVKEEVYWSPDGWEFILVIEEGSVFLKDLGVIF
jgi:hypothetical protein